MSLDELFKNCYGMYTDSGDRIIANLVDRAREQNMTWPQVYRELERLSDMPGTEESTDTEVREAVFCRLGFHKQDVAFYC